MEHGSQFEQTTKRGFFQRYGFLLGVLGIAAVVGIIFAGQSLIGKGKARARSAPEPMMVRIAPLPPPPPPPPPPPQAMEQKMISQTPVADDEQKPEEAPAPAAAEVGTNITGTGGPDAFGLSGGGSGGGTRIARRSSGSRWGWYAASVQRSIGEALRRNDVTRTASFTLEIRIWADLTGRIARAQLAGTTGDPRLDAAIRDDVLTGLRLGEAPPRDMPLPIVLRLSARRPD
ncbi:MAG: hypothetical protein JSS11_06800 [Verrucomicrobia bacterium]|nr:hypothetical protein [Verrucomicrobiota bacterium]